MQGKAPLSHLPGSPSLPDSPTRKPGKFDGMWGAPNSAEKAKQVEVQAGLALVPIDSIEELDRLQRLLSTVIKLGAAVSNERLKAERASVNVRHLTRTDSSGGDAAHWYGLIEQVEEIAALVAATGQAVSFPKQVGESIDRFHEARKGANEKAHEIAEQLVASSAELPEAARRYEMSRAVARIRMALEQCASTCDSESQDSLRRIEHRVQSILERIARQEEPSAKPTGTKPSQVGQEMKSEPSGAVDDRKLTESGGDGYLKQPKER